MVSGLRKSSIAPLRGWTCLSHARPFCPYRFPVSFPQNHSMECRIREAALADLPHLVHHRRAMFEDMGHTDTDLLDRVDRASKQYFEHALRDGAYKAWLAEDSAGTVLAGGGIVLADWPGFPGETLAKRAWILNMYTEPQARRRGIAKQLLQVILEWSRTHGLSMVSLHASPAGRPLYASLGFQPTNEMRIKLRNQ
jgi:GNAT superfamily N-acetyltransferase